MAFRNSKKIFLTGCLALLALFCSQRERQISAAIDALLDPLLAKLDADITRLAQPAPKKKLLKTLRQIRGHYDKLYDGIYKLQQKYPELKTDTKSWLLRHALQAAKLKSQLQDITKISEKMKQAGLYKDKQILAELIALRKLVVEKDFR